MQFKYFFVKYQFHIGLIPTEILYFNNEVKRTILQKTGFLVKSSLLTPKNKVAMVFSSMDA